MATRVTPFAAAERISARFRPYVHGPRAGLEARRSAQAAAARATTSVSMWPASAKRANERLRTAAVTSPTTKAPMSTSARSR